MITRTFTITTEPQIQLIYLASRKDWAIVEKSEPLLSWFTTENYNVNKIVQHACKILQRMNRPQTVGEFLSISPTEYRGLHGVGEMRYPLMVDLRQQFLWNYPQLDDEHYSYENQ